MEEFDVVKALASLAQPIRLRVFRSLVTAGPVGMTPGQLVESLGTSGTGLSFHLKELVHAGLVTQERQGRNLVYRAEFAKMTDLIGYLTENCCQGQACGVPAGPVCAC